MQLRQCEYFDAFVRYGSLRAAAKRLLVTEPTISVQLRSLERELKVTLFVRKGRGLELTPDGIALAPLIRQTLNAARSVLRTAEELRQLTGTLRVGVVPTYAGLFVSELMTLCEQNYAGVSLEVVEGGALSLEGEVVSGALDVAVVVRSPSVSVANSDLSIIRISRGQLVAVVSDLHRLSEQQAILSAELATEQLLLFRPGYLVHALASHLLGEGVVGHSFYISDNSESAREIVRSGRGISLAIDIGIDGHAASRSKLNHLPIRDAPLTELCCVYQRDRYLPRMVAESLASRLARLIGHEHQP
jgi:DNA-binding transcriptional LysR family regulator